MNKELSQILQIPLFPQCVGVMCMVVTKCYAELQRQTRSDVVDQPSLKKTIEALRAFDQELGSLCINLLYSHGLFGYRYC